jgi:D-xylose 1-dehydrogenase (NADP+, D-xylono-1,5-lactone-forming)
MDTLQWGLLSTARINRDLIPPIHASRRSELVAVASRNQTKAEAYAREWQIPRAYGSYEGLLADKDIDAIYISLPNAMHAEWSIKCAEAGKHVLVEKPIALTTNEVDEMIDAAKKNKVVIAEAFMYQHHPQTAQVLELVKQGAIGDLKLIKGAFTFNLIRTVDVRLVPEQGGGSIWDVGCYPISYARLIAQAEPMEVFGWQVTGATGVDEVFSGQMRFADGLLAQFDSGFRSPLRAFMEIVGASGTLELANPFKPNGIQTFTINRGEKVERFKSTAKPLYLGEIEDMESAVIDHVPQRISLEDSRANVAAIVALLESARTGRVVKI